MCLILRQPLGMPHDVGPTHKGLGRCQVGRGAWPKLCKGLHQNNQMLHQSGWSRDCQTSTAFDFFWPRAFFSKSVCIFQAIEKASAIEPNNPALDQERNNIQTLEKFKEDALTAYNSGDYRKVAVHFFGVLACFNLNIVPAGSLLHRSSSCHCYCQSPAEAVQGRVSGLLGSLSRVSRPRQRPPSCWQHVRWCHLHQGYDNFMKSWQHPTSVFILVL